MTGRTCHLTYNINILRDLKARDIIRAGDLGCYDEKVEWNKVPNIQCKVSASFLPLQATTR